MSNDVIQTVKVNIDKLVVSPVRSMGYGVIPKIAMLETELSIQAKAIYAYFCSHTGRGNSVFPGRDRILSDLNMATKTYYSHFNQLKEKGYLSVAQEKSNSRFLRNVYTIIPSDTLYLNRITAGTSVQMDGIEALGYGIIPKLVMLESRLDIKAKAIYAYFCVFAGSGDEAFPTLQNILFHLDITEKTYYKHLKALTDLNYISIEHQYKDGKRTTNIYRLVSDPVGIIQPGKNNYTDISKQPSNNNHTELKDQSSNNYHTVFVDLPGKFEHTKNEHTKNYHTNINNTNINSLNINQSIDIPDDGMMESKTSSDILLELKENKSFPFSYLQNDENISAAVRILTDYSNRMEEYRDNSSLEYEAFRLFTNALIEMLSSKELMSLSGRMVNASKVCEKLNEYIEIDDNEINIDGLKDIAINDYINACKETKIKNHLKYMMACIWNAMQKGSAGLKAEAVHIGKEEVKEKKDLNELPYRRSGEMSDLMIRAIEETNRE